jgi:hypothetical protein
MPTTMSIRRFSRNLLITVVAVATISTSTVALVGPAGASATKDPAAASKAAKHRELARALVSDCVTAHKWLNHESRIEHRFAKRLHRLRVWEADARADTHVRALRARALGTTSKSFSRERRLAKAVSPTCAALVRMIRAEKKAGKTHRNEAQAKARAARAAKAAHIEAVAAAKAAAAKAAAAKAAAAKAAAAKAAAAKTTGTKAAGTKTTAPPTPPTTTPTTSTTTPTSTTSTSTTTSTTSR